MLKVGIVTDGPYGERAYENINKEFDTAFIELEEVSTMFIDDIEILKKKLRKLRGKHSYYLHFTSRFDLRISRKVF